MACHYRDGEVFLTHERRYETELRPQVQHRLSSIPRKERPVTTLKISEEMNIDIAPDGTVYGIEILNANEQLAEDQGKLVVEWAGQHREILLSA